MSRPVVIGGSAGALDAVREIAQALPENFPAPLFLVIHIPATSPSLLPEILDRQGPLEARHPADGERYRDGVIYVAPPDRHLVIERGRIRLVRGPRENRHRPAVDPLFRSAAVAEGPNVIGVVLTGALDDGTAGMVAIRQAGGTTIVQDPEEAIFPSMPSSVIEHLEPDFTLPLHKIAATLTSLVSRPVSTRIAPWLQRGQMDMENRIITMDSQTLQEDDRPGNPSAFSCPDCGGVLWELQEGELTRFRCRVGHAFSPETMLDAQAEVLEHALFSALKTLEESARLSKRLADTEVSRGHTWMADRFREREAEARQGAESIRRFLIRDTAIPVPVETETQPAQ